MPTIEELQNLPLSTDIAEQAELDEGLSALSTSFESALGDFAKLSGLTDLSSEIVNGLSNTINVKLSSIANLVSAEVEKVDELSNNYVPLTTFQELEARVSALESRLSDY